MVAGEDRASTVRDRRADRRARTCVGCGQAAPLSSVRSATSRIERMATGEAASDVLVRLVVSPEGEVSVDAGDGRYGRGAHVHPTPSCLEKGARGLRKSARRQTLVDGEPPSASALAQIVEQAFRRRVEGLLVAARRSRKIAVGSDATVGSLRSGRGKLVVLAGDAAAVAKLGEVRFAIEEGRAVSFGDKASLAELVRPTGPISAGDAEAFEAPRVAVLAIEDVRLAAALREAVHVLDSVRAVGASSASLPRRKGRGPAKGAAGAAEGPGTASFSDAEPHSEARETQPREGRRNFDHGAALRRASGSPDAVAQAPDGRTTGQRTTRSGSAVAPMVSGSTDPEGETSGSDDEPEGVPGTGPGTGGVERGA